MSKFDEVKISVIEEWVAVDEVESIVYYDQLNCLSWLLVFAEVLHHLKAKPYLHIHLILYRFYYFLWNPCLLQIVIVHENITFVCIHYDKTVVPCLVEKFKPACISLIFPGLGRIGGWWSIGWVVRKVLDGLNWSGCFVNLIFVGGEGCNWDVLWLVVEECLWFATCIVRILVVIIIQLLWCHMHHMIILMGMNWVISVL